MILNHYDVILRNAAGETVYVTHLWLENDKQALRHAINLAGRHLGLTADTMECSVREQVVTITEPV